MSADEYKKLLIESRNGNHASRDALAIKIQDEIRPFFYRILHDKQLADDLTQETILKTLEKLNDIKDPLAFKAWLFRTARGRMQMHYRKEQKFHISQTDKLDEIECYRSKTSINNLVEKELYQTAKNSMLSLDPINHEIIVMRLYHDFSYNEMGKVMGCSSLSARVRFHNAKSFLKKQLASSGFKGMLLPALMIYGDWTAKASSQEPGPVVTSQLLKSSPVLLALGAAVPLLTIAVVTIMLFAPAGAIIDKISGYFTGMEINNQITTPSGLEVVQYNQSELTVNNKYTNLNDIENMDKFLAAKNYDVLNIAIKPGESIVFSFPGIITNGPGDDIFVSELGPDGEAVEVYLCDDADNEIYLGLAESSQAPKIKNETILDYPTTCKFDISEYTLKFEPTKIKLVGPSDGKWKNAFELHQLNARVKMQEVN
ncbi:MAG: sigma-70 family RNA polymerase sigma factor [Phycisphaerae bacterium]|nr:sigma-70 family RNA polymerase sigma factor [Phycisphaerae bacterium]